MIDLLLIYPQTLSQSQEFIFFKDNSVKHILLTRFQFVYSSLCQVRVSAYLVLSITDMYYNEPYQPLFTINPLESRDLNRTYTNTFSTSKRSSLSKSQAIKPIKNRTTYISNKENRQCTFEPKVNHYTKQKRSISKFIRDQESFQKTKEDKIKQLRMEINRMEDEELTCTPKIDRNSKQIATCKNSLRDSNPFQRLSKQRISHIPTEQYIFSPKILSRSKSIVRTSNVSSLLYQDARRRQQKQQFLLQSQRKQIDMLMSPKINKNTNVLVLKKINAEFDQLITDQEINPLIALSVLEEIFNIDLNPNKNIVNNQLVQKVIAILAQSDNFGSLKSKKLKEFISIIVIGQGNNTFFTNQEENYIIQNFQHFYKRRMTKQRKTPTPQKHTFRPKTLSSSSKMANSYREKTCQQLENFVENQKINVAVKQGGYSIEDIFQLEHMKRQNDNERKKIQKERRQLQECTFKPDLSTSQTSINLLKKKPKVTLKAPNRSKIIKTQYLNNDDTEFSIQNSKILLTKNHQSRSRKKLDIQAMNVPLTENVKDAEKVLLRMSIGRQKREYSQTVKERGYPKNQNWNEYQRQMHLQQIQNNKKLKGITGQ